jgi:hypothetical protein
MSFAFWECEKRSAEHPRSPEGDQPFGRMEPYVIRFPSCQEYQGDLENAQSAGIQRQAGQNKTAIQSEHTEDPSCKTLLLHVFENGNSVVPKRRSPKRKTEYALVYNGEDAGHKRRRLMVRNGIRRGQKPGWRPVRKQPRRMGRSRIWRS